MMRSIRHRLGRLEQAHAPQGIPNAIFSNVALPDGSYTAETVERWISDGLAHIAFNGRAVFYDGGEREPLTVEQWQARYTQRAFEWRCA
jgi:hypothetical protein